MNIKLKDNFQINATFVEINKNTFLPNIFTKITIDDVAHHKIVIRLKSLNKNPRKDNNVSNEPVTRRTRHTLHQVFPVKGILGHLFIFILEQIIVWNKFCTYNHDNKPIPKTSHVKTLQNLCKIKLKTTTIITKRLCTNNKLINFDKKVKRFS